MDLHILFRSQDASPGLFLNVADQQSHIMISRLETYKVILKPIPVRLVGIRVVLLPLLLVVKQFVRSSNPNEFSFCILGWIPVRVIPLCFFFKKKKKGAYIYMERYL